MSQANAQPSNLFVAGCNNDPLAGNKPVAAQLSDCELAANSATGVRGTVLSSMANGSQSHGRGKQNTGND